MAGWRQTVVEFEGAEIGRWVSSWGGDNIGKEQKMGSKADTRGWKRARGALGNG